MDNIQLWKFVVGTVHKTIDFAIMSTLSSYLLKIKINRQSNKILHKLESFIFILRKESMSYFQHCNWDLAEENFTR